MSASEDAELLRILSSDYSRDGLMLSILRFCGMRPQELLRLRKRDIDETDASIWVRGLKGSNDRRLPLDAVLFKRLVEMSSGLESDDVVFGIGYKRLQKIWHFYRPVRKPLKSLRHTLADVTYRKTNNLRMVQQVLGHKSLTSTAIYLSSPYGVDELRAALVG